MGKLPAFCKGIFWNAVKNSLLYALFGTTFQILNSFLLAYLVEFGSFKRKKLLRILFVLPIVATTATMGMMMKSFFNHEGILNIFLTSVGLSAQPFLKDPKYVFGVMILVSVWKETGTLFIYWLAGFQMVSEEMVEAAKIDGVTTFSLLTKIIMPMIKPVLVMITTVTFLNSLKVFDLIQTMTSGGLILQLMFYILLFIERPSLVHSDHHNSDMLVQQLSLQSC